MHQCDSCINEFPTCKAVSHDITWSELGDQVISCPEFLDKETYLKELRVAREAASTWQSKYQSLKAGLCAMCLNAKANGVLVCETPPWE